MISGATGLVGSILIKKLVSDVNCVKVISVSRKSVGIKSDKLNEVLVRDFSELATHREVLNGDVYFSCLGTTIKDAGSQENFRKIDFDAILAFGKIAEFHAGQALVVISASGANPRSAIFYNRIKGEIEASLLQLKIDRIIIFRPGLLMGNRKVFRLSERIFVKLFDILTPLLPSFLSKRIMTSAETLAERMMSEARIRTAEKRAVEAAHI